MQARLRKTRTELEAELRNSRLEIARLTTIAESDREIQEKWQRLGTFPEENPNPVIELSFSGATTYLNPVAQARFPELWDMGCAHPLMKGLPFPYVARPAEPRSFIVREVEVGESVFEQKVCYMGEVARNHIRVYVHDITRLKRAEETNQKLLKRLLYAHEEERKRVSRELHDEAGQALAALKLGLELIKAEIPKDARVVRKNLTEAISLTESTKEQIRMLAQGLRPPALDALGLSLTLESFCRDFARRTQLAIAYRGDEVPLLPDAANMCLYRTLQGALTNVVRHAAATCVDVSLRRERDRVSLVVEDNGAGIRPSRRPAGTKDGPGIGLIGMQERLDLFGGGLEVCAGEAGGVRLTAHLPLRETA